jgi:hypothetical protein
MTPEQAQALAGLLTDRPNEAATVAYYTESGGVPLEHGYVLATFDVGTFSIVPNGKTTQISGHGGGC